jgi:hypothetical protein
MLPDILKSFPGQGSLSGLTWLQAVIVSVSALREKAGGSREHESGQLYRVSCLATLCVACSLTQSCAIR